MFESLIHTITTDAYSELFFLFAGSLILYFLQTAYARIKKMKYKFRLRAEIDAYKK
jgi:hypothetical protein